MNVLESLNIGVLMMDESMKVLYSNAYSAQLLRKSHKKIQDAFLDDIIQFDFLIQDYCLRCLRERKTFHIYGQKGTISNESTYSYDLQLFPHYSGEEVTGVILVLTETPPHIHCRETNEEEEEKADSLSLLVSSVAHEIQNPLAGLKGASQLLKRELKEDQNTRPYLDVMLKELNRIDRMIKTLLLHSKEVDLHMQSFNIHELLDDISLFQQQLGGEITFYKSYDPSLPDVIADKDKTHQVILNIIKNAIEASPQKGTISIYTRFGAPWQIPRILKEGKKRFIYIDIVDEGSGIPEEVREKIFAPFFTTKKSGNGLGLSISFRLMKEQKGYLQISDDHAPNNCFRIWVPADI